MEAMKNLETAAETYEANMDKMEKIEQQKQKGLVGIAQKEKEATRNSERKSQAAGERPSQPDWYGAGAFGAARQSMRKGGDSMRGRKSSKRSSSSQAAHRSGRGQRIYKDKQHGAARASG